MSVEITFAIAVEYRRAAGYPQFDVCFKVAAP